MGTCLRRSVAGSALDDFQAALGTRNPRHRRSKPTPPQTRQALNLKLVAHQAFMDSTRLGVKSGFVLGTNCCTDERLKAQLQRHCYTQSRFEARPAGLLAAEHRSWILAELLNSLSAWREACWSCQIVLHVWCLDDSFRSSPCDPRVRPCCVDFGFEIPPVLEGQVWESSQCAGEGRKQLREAVWSYL